tara:strand:+ start:519 stop:710 length:192 start_codon:yes stop_codon:yes gene_type:complete
MRESRNNNSGGGYIDTLSRLKAKAIRTPLHIFYEWNTKVNKCNSIEKLENLLTHNTSQDEKAL